MLAKGSQKNLLHTEEVKLSKNRVVAEFHPRDTTVYEIVQFGKGTGRVEGKEDSSEGSLDVANFRKLRTPEGEPRGVATRALTETPIVTHTVVLVIVFIATTISIVLIVVII